MIPLSRDQPKYRRGNRRSQDLHASAKARMVASVRERLVGVEIVDFNSGDAGGVIIAADDGGVVAGFANL